MNNGNGTAKQLAKFGLTEKEVQRYLHLLREGSRQPAQPQRSLERFKEQALRRVLDERS
jgi:hypothetical protein